MALKYPDILRSNNPAAYGIVPATEVSGHKQVANLTALYALADPILSLSGNNTNDDAIGQQWYVVSEQKHYQLISWANRKKAEGWTVAGGFKESDAAAFEGGVVTSMSAISDADSLGIEYTTNTRAEDGTWEETPGIVDIPVASDTTAGAMTAADKTKLDGIATGAEVNQNAFANVKVGGTTIAADAKQDTIELVAGDNITITPDATNDKITIKATDTTYTVATTEKDGLMSKEVVDNMGTTALVGVEDATGTVTQATDKVSVSIETTIQDKNYITGATDEDSFTTSFAIPQASTDKAGVMSSADKAKLDNLKPATLGQGYGTCTTGTATAAKVVTLSSYELVIGGIVSVKFDSAVGASATMNINGKGAKPIYYRGSAIVTGVIRAGDVATFIYDGSKYIYLGTDNALSKAGGKMTGAISWTTENDIESYVDETGYTYNGVSVVQMNANEEVIVRGEKLIKQGGTEKQILMANGSVAGIISDEWLEANLK